MHVLVEKPMCFSVAEGREMVDAADKAGVTLMVAYNKRYDPAYVRLVEESARMRDVRLFRITTLESPLEPYVGHYNLRRGGPLPKELAAKLTDDNQARITAAIGEADPLSRWAYHLVLLDSLVHELNAMRGVMGEPERLEYSDIRETGLTAIFKYGDTQCILAWVDLPGIARYEMEFALLLARPPADAVVSVALSSQHAHAADLGDRRGQIAALVADRGDHLVQRELQGGADPLPRLRDHRPRAGHVRARHAARHRALRGDRRRAPHRALRASGRPSPRWQQRDSGGSAAPAASSSPTHRSATARSS